MLSRVCGKKFVGGVRSQDSGVRIQESGFRRLFYLFSPHPTPHTPLPNSYFVLFVKKTFFLQ
ncbi:MAG: hypothetical protein EWV40_05045 [Microcystis flos-aquae Mf_WU_F_19750830_S460]|uniref:Uncharacterized protein n=1 Tax=Microcystis flos-aquae Mf_WU_F_19750830_S460 TaxID=2486237 RepID=A0A552LYK9_9CHRO|nr:MAG: hypothetical protein EWV40_05045 [Microcystis flos-aquae Mf_WU_F_19750830_S460]